MIPVQYSESVALANVRDYGLDRFLSVCDQTPGKRVKEEVCFGEVLDSVGFADSVYCYLDSTKRRFRSTVFYEPAIRPKSYSETYYILPRHNSVSCESMHEHHPNKVTRRWYSNSLVFGPREFNSGISVVGPDDVFDTPGVVEASRKTGSVKDKKVGKGLHRSTVEVNVKATPAKPELVFKSDKNNNVRSDDSYTIRYRSGDGVSASAGDEIVFRSAVKVIGGPTN